MNAHPVAATAAVSSKNAVPVKDSYHGRRASVASDFKISSTQAIILGALFVFLLLIGLVIFIVSWVANSMLKMQRRHEERILELQRLNGQNSVDGENDTEGRPDKGNDPKLLKGKATTKSEKYGRFEDEINISKDDFPEVNNATGLNPVRSQGGIQHISSRGGLSPIASDNRII